MLNYINLQYFLKLWIYKQQTKLLKVFKILNNIKKQAIFLEIVLYAYIFRKLILKKIPFSNLTYLKLPQNKKVFNFYKFLYFFAGFYKLKVLTLYENNILKSLNLFYLEPLTFLKAQIYNFTNLCYNNFLSFLKKKTIKFEKIQIVSILTLKGQIYSYWLYYFLNKNKYIYLKNNKLLYYLLCFKITFIRFCNTLNNILLFLILKKLTLKLKLGFLKTKNKEYSIFLFNNAFIYSKKKILFKIYQYFKYIYILGTDFTFYNKYIIKYLFFFLKIRGLSSKKIKLFCSYTKVLNCLGVSVLNKKTLIPQQVKFIKVIRFLKKKLRQKIRDTNFNLIKKLVPLVYNWLNFYNKFKKIKIFATYKKFNKLIYSFIFKWLKIKYINIKVTQIFQWHFYQNKPIIGFCWLQFSKIKHKIVFLPKLQIMYKNRIKLNVYKILSMKFKFKFIQI